MLVSFSPTTEQSVLKVFAEIIGDAGFSLATIRETARRYSAGMIEGHNNRFPPSTAQFCEQARLVAREQMLKAAEGYPEKVAAYLCNAAAFSGNAEVSNAYYRKAVEAMEEQLQ